LIALSAIVISRVFKLGQENARQASVVASTSLQQTQKNIVHVRNIMYYLFSLQKTHTGIGALTISTMITSQ
jgi:hypothetical protein